MSCKSKSLTNCELDLFFRQKLYLQICKKLNLIVYSTLAAPKLLQTRSGGNAVTFAPLMSGFRVLAGLFFTLFIEEVFLGKFELLDFPLLACFFSLVATYGFYAGGWLSTVFLKFCFPVVWQ